MTVLHCSQKLFKRLRQPPTPPEPAPADNPLGPWYADIDFIDREPFAVLMNAATGASLVLTARAADLHRLHALAAEQLAALFAVCGIEGAQARAELEALAQPFAFARTRDRSLVASMNQRKFEVWTQFAYGGVSAFEAAVGSLETPFTRKDLGRDYHFAADRLRTLLRPTAIALAFPPSARRH